LQSDEEQLKKILLTSIDLAAKLLLPASIGMALSASLIVNVVLGPQWQVAQSCLTILLAVLFARVGYIIPETMLVAVGRVRNSAKRQAIYACAGLVFSVLGICLYGLTGAVVGVALSIIIFYCTSIMALNYMVKETYFFYVKSHLVGMGIAVPAAMVWFLLHRWLGSGTPEDCISCAAYFVVLLFTYLSLAAKYIGYVYEIKVLLFNTIRRLLARGGAA
jgi:PST family polysaccharide transporter